MEQDLISDLHEDSFYTDTGLTEKRRLRLKLWN